MIEFDRVYFSIGLGELSESFIPDMARVDFAVNVRGRNRTFSLRFRDASNQACDLTPTMAVPMPRHAAVR